MATFVPPTVQDVARDQRARGVVRFWPAHYRGANVFKLTDGSYTQNQPADMTTVAVTYHGAHSHTVTAAEATLLTAAGYGSNLT